MKRRLASIATVALGALTLAACGDDTTDAEFGYSSTAPPAETVAEAASEEAPNAAGDSRLNCDMLLGDFSEDPDSGYRFVGGGQIRNTGNIGTIVEIKAEWEILGSDPVVETQRVRLPAGETRSVSLSVPATSDQVDAHQSAEGRCEIDAELIDTYGKVQ